MSALDELEALLAKATPGPWSTGNRSVHGVFYVCSTTTDLAGQGQHDAALIAAARNHLGELLRIARAVAAQGPVEPDTYNGLSCRFCIARYDMPDNGFGDLAAYDDAELDAWQAARDAWEKRAHEEMPHDHDCVYVAARELAGGGA